MNRMLSLKQNYIWLTLILIVLSISFSLSWDFNKGGVDWETSCQEGPQAPIDIAKPFTYRRKFIWLIISIETNLTFSYSNMMTEYSFYNDGNNLILEGDFGFMEYNGDIFFSTQILFYSPSMHTIDHEHLPLEMQIIHQNPKGEIVTVSVVFKNSESDYSLLLGKLHFDEEHLQKMTPFKPIFIKDQINLSKYLHSDQSYFIYDTVEIIPPCLKRNTMIILSDILYVSRKQLDNFPMLIRNKNKLIQDRKDRKLYVTFDIDNIKQLIASNHQLVNQNSQRKVEKTKIELVQQVISSNDKLSLNTSSLEANGTSPEDIQKALEKELDKLDNENDTSIPIKRSKTTKIVPFELVKERALAKDSTSKKVDLKQLGNIIVNKNKTMIIDKEFPITQSRLMAKEVYDKYLKWKEMKKNITNTTKLTPLILLELSKLNNEFLSTTLDKTHTEDKDSNIHKYAQDNPLIALLNNSERIDAMQLIKLKSERKNAYLKTREQLQREINEIKNEIKRERKTHTLLKQIKNISNPFDSYKQNKEEMKNSHHSLNNNKAIKAKDVARDDLESAINYYQRLEEIIIKKYKGIDGNNEIIFKLNNLEKDIKANKQTISRDHYSDLLSRITKILKTKENKTQNKIEEKSDSEDIVYNYQTSKLNQINEDIIGIERRLNKITKMNQIIQQRNHMERFDSIDESITMIQEKLKTIVEVHQELKEESKNEDSNINEKLDKFKEIVIKQNVLMIQNKEIIDYIKEIETLLDSKLHLIIQPNQPREDSNNIQRNNIIINDQVIELKINNIEQSNETGNDQITQKEKIIEKDDDTFSFVRIVKDFSKNDINDQIQVISNDPDMFKEKIKEFNKTSEKKPLDSSQTMNNTIIKNESIIEIKKQTNVDKNKQDNKQDFLNQEDNKKEQETNETVIEEDNGKLFKDTLLRINEKYLNYQSNLSKKPNLRKHQPNLSPSQNDYQLLKLFNILFNQLQSKLSSIDKINVYNSSYYPYLTEEGKIKITFTSIIQILKYSYEIVSIPLIEDNHSLMISKYIEEILQEQNAKLFTLISSFYIFTNVKYEEINTLSHDISKDLKQIDPNKVKEIIIYLINNTPFLLINDIKLFEQSKIFNTQLSNNECQEGTQLQSITLSKNSNHKNELELIINMIIPKENINVVNKNKKTVFKGIFGSFQQGTHYYEIIAIELYSPSRHMFEETKQRAAMEILIIGKDAYNDYSVIVVMITLGIDENSLLKAIENKQDETYSIANDYYQFDLSAFIPNKPDFVTYNGQMISSPCLKNIKWFVLTSNHLIMTQDQFYAFNNILNKQK